MTVVALHLLAVLASAASVDAAATVVLTGESDLVAAVEHSLAYRGVRVVAAARPGMVQVNVQSDPSGVVLSIHDRNGHLVERLVANAEIAAAVVESWVRDDLTRPLLEPHEIATNETAPPATGPPVAMRPSAASGASVAVVFEPSLATDGSLWMGAGLGACVRVGRFCVGLGIHVAGDTATTGNISAHYAEVSDSSAASCTEEHRALTRLDADALLTADLPIRLGAAGVAPGIGFGAGWLSTSAALGDHAGTVTTVGPRAEARILLSWPLGWGFSADIALRADVVPLAHRTHLTSGGFDLPGEPLGFARLGLGLRYGPLLRGP